MGQVLAWYLAALAVYVPALMWAGAPDRTMGLGRPRDGSTRVTLTGIALTLPVGFWLAVTTPTPWAAPLDEFLQLLTVPPEHFLIFGILATWLLPDRRLAWSRGSDRQGPGAAYAVVSTGVIFGLAHIGKPNLAEVATSFPLGLVFAWMTVRSGSIWPAVTAHAALNLVPMAVLPAGA
jgi:membrane protease YdiL (CAAX protease family)